MSNDRTMPQSAEAEAAVLSACMSDADHLHKCAATLTAEHFYQRSHQIMFRRLLTLHAAGQVADLLTITQALKDAGLLEEVGGAHYVTQVAMSAATSAHTDFYIGILAEKFKLRRLIELSADITRRAYDSQDGDELAQQAERDIFNLTLDGPSESNDRERAATELLEQIAAYRSGSHVRGIPSGHRVWDDAFGGLLPEHYYVLSARPGGGKTALAEQMIDGLARNGKHVLYVQRELSPFRALGRIAAKRAGLAWSDCERGRMDGQSLNRLEQAVKSLQGSTIHLECTSGCTGPLLSAMIRRYHRKHGLALVVVDYIQLCDITRGQDRRNAIAEASRYIRLAINETGCAALVLAQLRRETDQDTTAREPRLSDLKECGDLEQDADAVLGLWPAEARKEADGNPKSFWRVNWSILKNKDGGLGDSVLKFHGPRMEFENGVL